LTTFLRSMDADLLDAISGPVFYPVVFASLDWGGTQTRLHSGLGDIVFDSNTYRGVGEFGSIEAGPETGGIFSVGATLTLTTEGTDDDLAALEADWLVDTSGRRADIWLGVTDAPGSGSLIGEPQNFVTGEIGSVSLPDFTVEGPSITVPNFVTGEIGSVSLPDFTVEGPSITVPIEPTTHGRVKSNNVHSDAEHQATYSGDTMFERNENAGKWATSGPKW